MRGHHPCTHTKAGHIKWLKAMGFSQTDAAIILSLNVGQVNHVWHGHRFGGVPPIPVPDFD